MALALQASVLLRAGNEAIAHAWCGSRLGGEHGINYGTLDSQTPFAAMIERAFVN
jgi:putative acyl-CoA dehydrogenase